MWSIFEKAVNNSVAALDIVKRDVGEFCKTVSEDTTNYINGDADTPFGEPKHSQRAHSGTSHHGAPSGAVQHGHADDVSVTSSAYDRQQAQLEAIQTDPETYLTTPDPVADFERWCSSFDLDSHTGEISKVLMKQSVRTLHATLVPAQVQPRNFWLRYFYRLHLLKQDDDRRAALKAFALQPVENDLESWDDDEGWDGAGGDWQPIVLNDSITSSVSVESADTTSRVCGGDVGVTASADVLSSTPTPSSYMASVTTSNDTCSGIDDVSRSSRGGLAAAPAASASVSAAKHNHQHHHQHHHVTTTNTIHDEGDSDSTHGDSYTATDCSSPPQTSSSDASSPRSSPPPVSLHSPNKPVSSRARRLRQTAHQKTRQAHGQHTPSTSSPATTVSTATAAAAESSQASRRRKQQTDGSVGMTTLSSSSSLGDDYEAGDGHDTMDSPAVSAQRIDRSAVAAVGNDETSGSEIVVLGINDDASSQDTTPAMSHSSGRDVLLGRLMPSAVTSPPASSYGSDFEVISETDPSEGLSPLHRPKVTTPMTESTSRVASVAMYVSSDTTLQNVTATNEDQADSEDWESWD
eukprot:scpid49886/ scgid18925/ BSD domain-containing protein 1